MSNPHDPLDPNFDLSKEFDRLIAEGGVAKVELEPRYDCSKGNHKWLLYNGFRERYHYCDLCDLKDTSLLILK